MDELENLPYSEEDEEVEDEIEDTKQQKVMKKYFGKSETKSGGWTDMSKWKIIGAATVTFLALANPWVQAALSKIPYVGGNNMTELLAASVTFLLCMFVIVFFL